MDTVNSNSSAPHPKRKLLLTGMTCLFLAIGLGVFLYWLLWGRFYESTNDAYVSGNLVYVTPQVPGIVTSIYIDDTERVEQGHILVKLDPTDALIALESSKAELGKEIRNIAQLFSQTRQARSEIPIAKAKFIECAQDFERREALVDSGGVSKEDFEHARADLVSSYCSLISSEAKFFSFFAQVKNTSIKTHPRVQKAVEKVKDAWIQLRRTTLKAPVSGLIALRSVQVGQRVNPAEPLFAIIPLDQMWVDANFKEVQIGKMQIGQSVSLQSDTYGSNVTYHGLIVGIGGGTGSVFSVLPPQNATGNWIKIVQRLPIRVSLNPSELIAHPLRLGLSMEATVDIRNIGSSPIPELASEKVVYETAVFSQEEEGVDAVLHAVFEQNLPPPEDFHLYELEEEASL